MSYEFVRDPACGIIFVDIVLDEVFEFRMTLDTGASHTTFDFNALYLANYPIGNIIEKGMI